jgi:acetyl esterase/lipase
VAGEFESNVANGDDAGETLDVYMPPKEQLPRAVVIYIHGGMWQFLR